MKKIIKAIEDFKSKREDKKQKKILMQKQSIEEYKRKLVEYSKEISYEELLRNPDLYYETPIKVTVDISHISNAGLVTEKTYQGLQDGNYFLLEYDYEDNPRILKKDNVTFYGFFMGLTKAYNSNFEKIEVPKIQTEHHILN